MNKTVKSISTLQNQSTCGSKHFLSTSPQKFHQSRDIHNSSAIHQLKVSQSQQVLNKQQQKTQALHKHQNQQQQARQSLETPQMPQMVQLTRPAYDQVLNGGNGWPKTQLHNWKKTGKAMKQQLRDIATKPAKNSLSQSMPALTLPEPSQNTCFCNLRFRTPNRNIRFDGTAAPQQANCLCQSYQKSKKI